MYIACLFGNIRQALLTMGFKSVRENVAEKESESDTDDSPSTEHSSNGRVPVQASETDSPGSEYTDYAPSPNRQALSDRYGIAVERREAKKLQRLEEEFGKRQVRRWADQGMPVETMGKPRDMTAFRATRDASSTATGGAAETGMQVQPKLAVSSPNDPAEKEAERVSEKVMEMDDDAKISDEKVDGADRDQGETEQVRPVPAQCAAGTGVPEKTASTVRSGIQGEGKPLPAATRAEFESKMAADFSDVRVHTGPVADEGARSIAAKAYTVGSDIAFADGNYRPHSTPGRKLLAHELTHVVQQGGAGTTPQRHNGDRVARQDDGETEKEIKNEEGSSGGGKIEPSDEQVRDILVAMGMDSERANSLVLGGPDPDKCYPAPQGQGLVVPPEVSAARKLARLNNKIMADAEIATYFAVEHMVQNASLRIPEDESLSMVGDIQYASYEIVIDGMGVVDDSVDVSTFKSRLGKDALDLIKGRFIAHGRSMLIKETIGSEFLALTASAVLQSFNGLKSIYNQILRAEQAEALTVDKENRSEEQQRLVNNFRYNLRRDFLEYLQDYHPVIRAKVRSGEQKLNKFEKMREARIKDIRIFMSQQRGGGGGNAPTIERAPPR